MGKRKERRLAALTNAGRRVKLDLFAEPSGELGGSNLHGDTGGDTDSQHRDGLPNSPSSSGQQPQNPLLLLGQYSDEEGDDGSSKGLDDANVQSPMLNEEAKGVPDEGSKDLGISVSVDLVAQNNGQQNTIPNSTSLDVEYSERNESDGAAGKLQNEMVSKDQIYISESVDEQVVTDVGLGWKMVMHEESQRYYYWNIETGETSWEVPQVLVNADQLANDSGTQASANYKTESAAVGNNSNVLLAATQDTSAASIIDGSLELSATSHKELYGHGCEMNGGSVICTNQNQGSDVNGNKLTINDYHMHLSDEVDHSSVSKFSVEEQKLDVDFPSRLVKKSESLLEKLKSLKKSKENLQGQDSLSKHMLEIEIRLSDLRSLASYGSSLLPFWVHSERKIKMLESLTNDYLLQTASSACDKVEDKLDPVSEELGDLQNDMGHESEIDHNNNKGSLLISDVSNRSQTDASTEVLKDIDNQNFTNDQHVPLFSSSGSHMETGVVFDSNPQESITNPQESIHKHGYNFGEDDDMDVDMEVEDINSSGNTTVIDVSVAKDSVQTDQLVQLNPPVDCQSVSLEDGEFVVPPPPDDEWIPPPPPDNEHVPPPPPPDNDQVPPPPGDPQALSYSAIPSYTETGQPLSYAQYSLSYPPPAAEYYGQTAVEVPINNIYGQIAVQPPQIYYNSAVPNMYSENPQVIINPTDSVSYYEVQNGAVSNSIPAININDSGVGGVDWASSDVPSTSSTIHAPATVSVDDGVPLPQSAAESAAEINASSAVSKAQTKVVRTRKRAVAVGSSLKSNKKVSSLVDKWKAAKEEMLEEEEEEPDSVYEVLERKRQREIEEWHAKQIASGEAKDNANFQPLGGDWREKVKRKRAKAASESVSTPQDATEHNQQQPNLSELSKGLPANWQVYWDDSSKQVYYGNTITSETTWTRPTR